MIGKNGTKIKENQTSDVIFVDSTCTINDLQHIHNYKQKKIITFDYDSHILLSRNNIQHEISDNYLLKSEFPEIQNISYKFSNWYEEKLISEKLTFEGINLGKIILCRISLFSCSYYKKIIRVNQDYESIS